MNDHQYLNDRSGFDFLHNKLRKGFIPRAPISKRDQSNEKSINIATIHGQAEFAVLTLATTHSAFQLLGVRFAGTWCTFYWCLV